MRIVALDLSLTRSGVADSDHPLDPFVLAPAAALGRGWARIHWIQKRVQDILTGADLAVFEGYSYRSQTNAVRAGELGGIVRYTAWCMHIPYVDIAPATLKKVATGVGKGGKEGVLVEAVKRLGYDGSDNNESDALWLLQAALHHYGLPGAVKLPQAHTATLGKIDWPTFEVGVAA